MAIVATGELLSYATATPSWRRAASWVHPVASHDPYDWDTHGDAALSTPALGLDTAGYTQVDPTRVIAYRELDGATSVGIVSTSVWFEDVHTLPRAIELGLVIATREVSVEVYNAFRRESKSFTDWTNNDGPGIDLLGESFPTVYGPLEGSGETLTVEVLITGPPRVDSTLDFVWGALENPVRITLSRVLPFAIGDKFLIPENEITELLVFRTNVLRLKTGKEQRIRVRKNPRQVFEHTYKIDDGLDRARLDLQLANLHHRLWAVGVWEHEVALSVAATPGDTTLQVPTTAYSDFRVAGSLAVFVEDSHYEIHSINSIGAGSLVLDDALENSYPVGARVVPLRSAYLSPNIDGVRYPKNLAEVDLRFEVADNDVDLADTSGFSSYGGKVLFDDFNFMGRTISDDLVREFQEIDPGVGARYVDSDWILSRQRSAKTFMTKTAADRWSVRGVVHALGGQLTSFYLPTFRDDIEVSDDLGSGESTISIFFAGYSANAAARTPKDVIRVTLVDGTTYDRAVTGYTEDITGDYETLTLDDTWPSTIDAADVQRVQFLQKVRFATDTIRFDHLRGGVSMRTSAPVIAVLE